MQISNDAVTFEVSAARVQNPENVADAKKVRLAVEVCNSGQVVVSTGVRAGNSDGTFIAVNAPFKTALKA